MRIGLEYTLARSHAPGAGRYVRELVRALVRRADQPDLFLVEFGRRPPAVSEAALGLAGGIKPIRPRRVPLPRRALDLMFRAGIGAEMFAPRVDLFHHAYGFGPRVRRAREVIPIAELPRRDSAEERALRERAASAVGVLVFSPHYVDAVATRLAVVPSRIHVVPVGCDHWLREWGEPPVHPDRRRILVLGAMRSSRRPDVVLRATELLIDRGIDVELRIIGRRTDQTSAAERAVEASPARAHVVWDAPSEEEIPRIVASSSVLVHLNDEDEGTPVTPLEALSFGVDVVASRLPAFEEVVTTPGALLDDPDPESAATAIARALERADDTDEREARKARAAAFTWDGNAAATIDAWRRIAHADG